MLILNKFHNRESILDTSVFQLLLLIIKFFLHKSLWKARKNKNNKTHKHSRTPGHMGHP